MKRLIAVSLLMSIYSAGIGQELPGLFSERWNKLTDISKIEDAQARKRALDTYWDALKSHHQIPLTVGDSVAFLYRGSAKSVAWVGDFGWGSPGLKGTQLPGTDLWFHKTSFPGDARIDYKIVLDDKEMILDPANAYKQFSGAGGGVYNSELRMPDFKTEFWTIPQSNIKKGKLSENMLISSRALGYDLNYKVYTPAAYDNLEALPVVYVTDGHEYADDRMGALVTVTDNLIAAGKIGPVMLVFIDPRDPENLSVNKRADELLTNKSYLSFYKQELLPVVERSYKALRAAEGRGILGTSYGGVNSTYFAISANDVFGMVAINSPAYWSRPNLIEQLVTLPKLPVKVFLTTGASFDGAEFTRIVRAAFEAKGNELKYIEVNQGHSWGQWRTLMDDMLLYFFGR
ncbi:MAG TPA: alpha/beta hydrolase-fold protein [Sphingobacteriaceae bacterium]